MTEAYQPNTDEMAEAEAAMLPRQKKLTEKRVRVREMLREKGAEGILVSSIWHGDGTGKYPDAEVMEGELNGHKILAIRGKRFEARIDDQLMSADHAKALWQKYYDIASTLTKVEIDAARQQLASQPPYNPEHEIAAMLLKDIL